MEAAVPPERPLGDVPDTDLVDFATSVYASYDRWMTGELTKLERRWLPFAAHSVARLKARSPSKPGGVSCQGSS